MNADLDATVKELGPDYRSVVARLQSARTVEPSHRRTEPLRLPSVWRRPLLCAASLVAVCLLAAVAVLSRGTSERNASPAKNLTPYELAFSNDASAIAELVRTQAADGSWANDYLTRQNAAALREVASATIPYRRAVRYLRTRGLSPLSEEEFRVSLRHM